ncbi:MAG: peptidylprolyl isomerase [Lachnospiraceae bacterium]
MKHNRNKISALLLLLCMSIALLCSGCSIGNRQVYFASKSGRHTVFKIGEMACSREEAKVYLANYKNLYGKIYDTDLWSGDYDTKTMEESIKDAVLSHLTKVYSLNMYAKTKEITLTEEEYSKVSDAAEVYYKSLNRAERKYTGASKKDIEKMYEHYALAEKVYQQLMSGVDENVSEDEARIMEANVIYVTDASLAKDIATQLKNGASFDRLASTYSEADTIHVTFGRNTYDTAVEDVVFQLDNDEISDMIEAKDGYYFFECVNKYNEELSEQNKATIVSQRQENAMEDVTSAIETEYYSDFNQKLWDKITIDQNEKITTNSFFTTLDGKIVF